MSQIDPDAAPAGVLTTPDIYPRLAYRDELAAVEYLTRVFQFTDLEGHRWHFGERFHEIAARGGRPPAGMSSD